MPKLSPNAIARVGRVVKKAERAAPPPPRRDRAGVDASPGFWVELTEEGDEGDLIGWYKWKVVYPNTDGTAGWTDADPAITSADDFTATGANGTPHLVGQRVYISLYGYYDGDDPKTPVYVFEDDSTKLHKVVLDHVPDTHNYDVYPWGTTDFELTTPIVVNVPPEFRPLGTVPGFSAYATTGWGHYDDGAFVLVLAIEEKYQTCT